MELHVKANIWYKGNAHIAKSSPNFNWFPTHSRTWIALASIFLWDKIAAFTPPVVPPVYCKNAMSSLSMFCFLNEKLEPILRASLKFWELGSEYFV